MANLLVSVIICTRNRPASFRRALASVLAQDTDDYEVIVVDGSEPPVVVENRSHAPLSIIAGERHGEGLARAAGLRVARGELIAWCDDDAEWTVDHLRILRDLLVARPEVDLVHSHDPHDDQANAQVTEQADRPWGSWPGTTIRASDVMHRAAAARLAGGFDRHLRSLAAADLWVRMCAAGPCVALPRRLTTSHDVPGPTTSEDRSRAERALNRASRDVAERRGASRGRRRRRAEGVVPFNPDTWSKGRRELLFQTVTREPGSFPIVSKALIHELERLGVVVTLGPLREGHGASSRGGSRPEPTQDRLGLIYDLRTSAAGLRAERSVLYTVWETTSIPSWMIDEINEAATMLYVPCRENVRMFQQNGVVVPVKVLHHGVDPERMPLLERPRGGDEPFVFGCHSRLQYRKGVDVLIRAFLEEFAPHERVRLRFKHSFAAFEITLPNDPRITLTRRYFTEEQMRSFLQGLDAYVLPSRGEGFGLTGIEAMASGLPVIATNWSGPADYLDPDDSFPLRYRMGQVGGVELQLRRQFGCWAEPDVEHLRELMRYVFEHREQAAAMGRRASARVHRDWTWERVARQLVDDFDLLAQGVTPGSA